MTQGPRRVSVLRPRPGRPAAAAIHEASSGDIAWAVPENGQVTTAVVDDISSDGVATVVLSGEERPREAASVLRFSSATAASDALLGRTVLVVVTSSAHPIIVGAVAPRLWDGPNAAGREGRVTLPAGEARSVQLDKRRLDLEASEEIRLTCGKSSLLLRRDGTVIVRGVKIVSRASQANKIRGATVDIN